MPPGDSRLWLVDTSAVVRGALTTELAGELCLGAVTRMELLFSARSSADYGELELGLTLYRDLRMGAETFATAGAAQRELASVGKHRVPMPDLLVAACAQQHGADVLHVDRHFEVLASVLHFTPVRL